MKTSHLAGVAFLCALILSGVAGPLSGAEGTAGGNGPAPGTNPLYFRSLIRKPWWDQEWEYRIPVVIHESAGQERQGAPITISATLPEGAKLSSVRVVTPWGREIASQVRLLEDGTGKAEIFFVTDLLADEYLPLFIYCDDTDRPAPDYTSGVSLEEDERFFTLSNSEVVFRIRKDSPIITHIRPQGRRATNQLYDDNGLSPEGRAELRYLSLSPGKVTERGPLRTEIQYEGGQGDRPCIVTYALTQDANGLSYAVAGVRHISRRTDWLPGNGLNPARPDGLYFAGKEELKRSKVGTYGPLTKNIVPEMGEGWYAYHDPDSGQVVGEIFDKSDVLKLGVYVHIVRGYMTSLTQRIAEPLPTRGAILCFDGNRGYSAVRREYLCFKNPPEVSLAAVQRRADAPAKWRVPVYGRDMILCRHQSFKHYLGTKVYPEAPHRVLPHLIRRLKRDGSNWISLWAYQPYWPTEGVEGPRTRFLTHLVKQAHEAGMGVEVHSRGSNPRISAELASHGVDVHPVKDESCWRIHNEKGKKLFREAYGMEPPEQVEVEKLHLPAHHNLALFQMDMYTKTIRPMAEAAKAKNPKMLISDQVNVSSMVRIHLGAPHDWERHSDFLDTLSMDLYGLPNEHWKFYAKLMRATFGNRKPVMMYWGCDSRAETVRPNMDYLLMWGIDGLIHFSPGSIYKLVYDEVKKNYRRLDYTGLGDLLAQYEPAKCVALFRDREGMIDSIKRGQWTNGGSVYDGRIRDLTYISNFQTDIVFTKYVTAENLKPYPVLVVANDPVLADKHANAIGQYLKAGGNVILEGEGLRNKVMQTLAGVEPKGGLEERKGELKGERKLSFSGYAMPVESRDAEKRMAFEDGKPVLFSKEVGAGRLLYTPLILSEKVTYQEEVAEFFRGLVRELGGTPPVFLKESSSAVDSNLLTNGRNFVLAVYNRALAEGQAKLGFALPQLPEVIVDFSTGEMREPSQGLELRIPKGEVVFFYLGSKADLALPEVHAASLKGTHCYTKHPGESVLELAMPEYEELEGKPKKREKEEGLSYVAILTDKGKESANPKAWVKGDAGIHEALQGNRGLKVEYIWDLKPKTVAFYDAVIIPHIGHAALPPVMDTSWGETIREYVVNGGAVLLCHHAAGYRSLCQPIFPEVGEPTGAYVAAVKDMIVKAEHPVTNAESMKKRFPKLVQDPAFQDQFETTVFKLGGMFRSSYPDYLPLKPGPSGKTLVQAAMKEGVGGEPVVVTGAVGQGKVLLTGLALGAKDNKQKGYTKGEQAILINACYWLTER